ncbi:hypothetical protein C8C83_4447 [Flavobacterium sp. 90]|uniref:hypothetical protein n=1 Tax=Flavobacterium sp. 90 TaxID=2135622 RepID=UPI0010466D7D|nr:hypothetical protein [Flavobacterium sp. 90]TCK56433.1 hypothetical protein C8C83_4447 [Flavobacterium sp. 90]
MSKSIHSFVRVSAPCGEVFPYFFSLNLLQVFKGFWFVPNIESAFFKIKSAKPGSERLIYFEDCSTAVCQLFDFTPQVSFSVQIDNFTSSCFIGLEAMRCHFSFSDSGSGMTQVNSHYQFKMHSPFWNLLFEVFFRRIMQQRLDSVLIQTAKELKFFIDWKLTLD